MVNDEMLKKLKDQYIGVEVPDDEKNKLNEILEYAKIDKKRKRKKRKSQFWDYKKKLRRKCWRMYLRLSAGE